MSTGGQAAGGLLGAIGGFLLAGPGGGYQGAMYGAQIGMMVGGYLDPVKTTVIGPRLSDLTVQTSTYGAVIPRIYGTVPIVGNVFWLEGNKLKEVTKKKKSGGKGGSQTTTKTFSYYATFAVGLVNCMDGNPIAGARRVWIGSKLIYDAGSPDLQTIVASNQSSALFSLYLGTNTQTPDDRIQADMGVANTPAYRGLAYIVFKDYPLADHGNSLLGAQVKVEVVKAGSTAPLTLISNQTSPAKSLPGWAYQYSPVHISIDLIRRYMPYWDSNYPASSFYAIYDFRLGAHSIVEGIPIATPGANVPPTMLSDNPNRFWISSTPYIGTAYYAVSGNIVECGDLIFGTGVDGARLLKKNTPLKTLSEAVLPRVGTTDGQFCYDIDSNFLLRKFDDQLNLLASITLSTTVDGHAFTMSSESRMCVWEGYLWLFPYAAGASPPLFRIDTALTTPEFFGSLPSFSASGSYYNIESKIIDGVIIRTCPDNVAYVERTQYVQINSLSQSSISLASIVSAECLSSKVLVAGDIDVTALTQSVRGYKISSVSTIRSAIEPLQGVWPFDVVQHGYKIKFIQRGGSSVATIPAADLDARGAGDSPGVSITASREMDSQLPCRVSIKYLDLDREYDVGEQYDERLNTDAINVLSLDLAIVMTADEAAKVAQQLLYLYWLERYDLSFSLPPTYAQIEAGDVITVNADEASYTLRLPSVTYDSDGRLECKAKYSSAAIYAPTAVGSAGQSTGQTLSLPGAADTLLLDIPLLDDTLNTPGFPVAMTGYLSGWPGGQLVVSADAGQTWDEVQGFAAPGSVIGTATSVIGIGRTNLIDKSSVLSVALLGGTLSSVTELSMLAGANWFSYGAPGRWEIIAAQNCTYQGGNNYLLTDLLRGRQGTEWACGLHVSGDRIVELDSSSLAFITTSINSIGLEKTYRGVTIGKTIDSASDQLFTYSAVNLECLSPVYLNGNRHPTTNDWTLIWIRRTRVGGAWRDLVDASLGETSEAYEVEIFSDNTYATLKRTLTGLSSATAAYTSAQQVTDFGSNQATLYVKVYQISSTVGRGYPLITSITR